jgi:hypothetical protein
MKYISNDVVSSYCDEALVPSVINLCALIREYPFLLRPFRRMNEEVRDILSTAGFQLYPTVKKTTLFYEQATDSFLKIIHPLTIKHRIFSIFTNKARSIYRLSLDLRAQGIKVPGVRAYGIFKRVKKPFLAMKRIEGKSILDILRNEKRHVRTDLYLKVMEEVARFHSVGYWFGDAQLAHIFVDDSGVSGFIDMDSIRKNRLFRPKNLAKDLAGIFHPELLRLITEEEKMVMINCYMSKIDIKNKEKFLQLFSYYSARRWKK